MGNQKRVIPSRKTIGLVKESIQMYEYDFFEKQNINKDEIFRHIEKKSGEMNKRKVSILIPTYKRNDTLKYALKSALTQKGFDDYQIIIMDNAGISKGNTETENLVRSFNDPKIVYFQQDEQYLLDHKELNVHPFNALYCVADSEWVCMLHDDDVLSPDYLFKMTSAVNTYDDIDGLICDLDMLICSDNSNEPILNFLKKEYCGSSEVFRISEKKHPKHYVHFVLGAFMKLSKVRELGGYPCDYNIIGLDGMADFVLAVKYAYYFRSFFLDNKLYGYRISKSSSASANHGIWRDIHVCRAHFIRSIAEMYGFPFCLIMKECADYETIDNIDALNNPDGNTFGENYKLDKEQMLKEIGIREHYGLFGRKRRSFFECLGYMIRDKNTSKDVRKMQFERT